MSSCALADLINTEGTRKQDSLLVERHDRIVAEAYYASCRAGIPHDLRSTTKSVIDTLQPFDSSSRLNIPSQLIVVVRSHHGSG
jgi:hypothetical protein